HRVRPYGFEKTLVQLTEYVDRVMEEIRVRGPLTSSDFPTPENMTRKIESAWHTVPRAVLEALFGRGILAIADRKSNFARAYDLAERLLPSEIHGRAVAREEAQRELLRQAARAHGIAAA